ncbi:MAG: hypothetical protein L3J22_06300 [Xanthomonadales bacterium]|nr:hypothetical protein [Xanthomonadales bacterium]
MLILFLVSNIAISLIVLLFLRYGKANNTSKLLASMLALIAWVLPLPYIHYLFPSKLSAEIIKFAPATFEAGYITNIGAAASHSDIYTLTNGFILVSIIGGANFLIKLLLHLKVQARIKNHNEAKYIATRSGTKIYASPEVKTGLLAGFIRPSIWVNPDLPNSQNYELIITHELIHKKLGDNYWILLIEVIRSLYWWNPIVSIVAKQSYLLLEARCDLIASKEFGADKYRDGLAELLYTGALEHQGYLSSKVSSNSINLQRLVILKEQQTMKSFTKLIFISTLVLVTVILSFSVVMAKSLADKETPAFSAGEFEKDWEVVSFEPAAVAIGVVRKPVPSGKYIFSAEIRRDGQLYNVQILESQTPANWLTDEMVEYMKSSKYKARHPNAKIGTFLFEVESMGGEASFANMSLENCESLKAAIIKSGEKDIKLPASAPCQID